MPGQGLLERPQKLQFLIVGSQPEVRARCAAEKVRDVLVLAAHQAAQDVRHACLRGHQLVRLEAYLHILELRFLFGRFFGVHVLVQQVQVRDVSSLRQSWRGQVHVLQVIINLVELGSLQLLYQSVKVLLGMH